MGLVIQYLATVKLPLFELKIIIFLFSFRNFFVFPSVSSILDKKENMIKDNGENFFFTFASHLFFDCSNAMTIS